MRLTKLTNCQRIPIVCIVGGDTVATKERLRGIVTPIMGYNRWARVPQTTGCESSNIRAGRQCHGWERSCDQPGGNSEGYDRARLKSGRVGKSIGLIPCVQESPGCCSRGVCTTTRTQDKGEPRHRRCLLRDRGPAQYGMTRLETPGNKDPPNCCLGILHTSLCTKSNPLSACVTS